MYKGKRVCVVVPAYNEQRLIGRVLETIPEFVDHIIVVDDASTDRTADVVKGWQKDQPRILILSHSQNRGVGAAIVTGYKKAIELKADVAAVMAGDGQMDPADLPRILDPVVSGEADYIKGNRLFRGESWSMIPKVRYLGNSFLSLLTKIASGYWHIADSQCGYTAISSVALERIDLDGIYPRYGMPNDLLIKLNIHDFRVRDVSVRPVYNIGEESGIRLRKVVWTVVSLLVKGFCRRLLVKYVIKDFHPLVFFYFMALALLTGSLFFFIRLVYKWIELGHVPEITALALIFTFISGFQSLFFAMWFDMENNRHLK